MKRFTFILFFIIARVCFSQSQYQLPQSIWAVGGGFNSSDNYLVSWTIGDVLIFTAENQDIVITQGFSQPMICKAIPIIVASQTTNCDLPYKLDVSPVFDYYRWKLDTISIANEYQASYLPVTNANYHVIVGDSSGCYLSSDTFTTDFSSKRNVALISISSDQGRDTLLTATQGISYQWFIITPQDTIKRAINNANTQTFRPFYNGEYFVRVNFNDYCATYSAKYNVNNSGNELLSSEKYNLNDSTIFFKYNRSQSYRLQLYPNPCKDYFIIDYESPTEAELIVKVFDVFGSEIERNVIAKPLQRLKVEYIVRWLSGIYIIKVDDGAKSMTEKLIVQ